MKPPEELRKDWRFLNPQSVAVVFEHVRAYLPDGLRDLNIFAQWYLRKDSAFFEVGKLEGACWLVNIQIGWKATCHIVFWAPRLLGHAEDIKWGIREVFRLYDLQRLEAFIPTTNEHACNLADKIGFTMEGTMRKAEYYDGILSDVAAYSLLKEDLNG